MSDRETLLARLLPVLDQAVGDEALTRDEAFSVLDLFGPERIADELDAIDHTDPEVAHGKADDLLLSAVNPSVAAAYRRLMDRCSWWAGA